MDRVSEAVRSHIMASVKSKNTGPEIRVRSLLHRAGYRFRLHAAELAGHPDIVFRKRRTVIFVHGCFWHGHDCRYGRLPKSRSAFWRKKIDRNRERDGEQAMRLSADEWKVVIVWQCEIRNETRLRAPGERDGRYRVGGRRPTFF